MYKLLKRLPLYLLSMLVVLIICIMLPTEVNAASESDLTFTLNSDGQSYSVTDCNSSASGVLAIPATYNGKPVTSIGDDAFDHCTSLTSVAIPSSVTSIGKDAFYYCTSLTSVTIPDSVTSVGEEAFQSCWNLTEVNISGSVTRIDDYTFSYCSSLINVTIPDSVKSIGDHAFSGCNSLTSVTIPDSVTSVGEGAFSRCYNLSAIHVSESNEYYSSDSYGVLFNKNKTELICAPGELSDTYTTPDSVTKIGNFAFVGCTSLTGITLPDGVTSIGRYAFEYCPNLTSITIPDSITSIGDYAFKECSQLSYHKYDNAYYLGNNDNPCVVLVDTISYTITSCEISASTKIIYDYAFSACSNLTSVTIPGSVTHIGYNAFTSCGLTNITIPNGVISIDMYAFSYCTKLSRVTLPDSLINLGHSVFQGCSALSYNTYDTALYLGNATNPYFALMDTVSPYTASCKIASSTKIIAPNAFVLKSGLTNITIPYGVISIGSCAFDRCGLSSITIPASVTSIGDYAFSDCSRLTSVTIPDSVTSIGDRAFSGCTKLSTFLVSENNEHYFSDSYGVLFNKDKTELISAPSRGISGAYTIPGSVTYVDHSAFSGCKDLTDIWYVGSENDRSGITILSGNQYLENAVWHYNCCSPDNHVYDNACDTVCNTCDFERTVPDHVYSDSCDITCNECDAVRSITHTYDHNCDAVCNVCGHERTPTDHVYTNACDKLCNICEYERTVSDHVYTDSCDRFCNICDHKRDIYHTYDNVNDITCNVCKETLAPAAPIRQSVTDTTVTLVAVDGYEYSKDKTVWQKSNVFSGLQPYTSYNFYQRVAATPDNLVSPASSPISIKTDKYTPKVPAAPVLISKTSTSVNLQAQPGYEYSKDGSTWQTSNLFTGLSPETEYIFYQRIAETGNSYESAPSQPLLAKTLRVFTVTYDANGGSEAPDTQIKDEGVALVLQETEPLRTNYAFKGWATTSYGEVVYKPGDDYTEDKDITLYAVWYTACPTCNASGRKEITCDVCQGKGSYTNEKSICCNAGVYYTIVNYAPSYATCRSCGYPCLTTKKEVSCAKTKFVSCTSCNGDKYLKATPPAAPQPELLSATLTSITVAKQSGMEYSIDGFIWQTSNVFENLSPNTQYTIYQRYVKNTYYNAGEKSEALLASTLTNYTIVFKNWNGAVLSSKTYLYGDTVIVPANPTKAADNVGTYTFAGWDKTVVACAGNATYTATYTTTYTDYTVTFKNWDGSILDSDKYHYNDTVTPPSTTPTRPEDSTYKYVFKGWDSEIVKAVANKIYTAIYDAIKKIVEITSNVFHIQGDSIGKVGVGTSASSFVTNLDQAENVKVYKGNTQISGNTAIGTGMEVKLLDGNTVVKSYTVVVTGDINGDGAISVTDMIAIKAHVLKKTLLTGANAEAGDTSNDNAISITDFIQVKAHILGKSSIVPN